MVTGTILAGGKARRFAGIEKAMLVVGSRRIIDRQLEALRRVAGHILIVANDRDHHAALGVPVHADIIADAGALGGVYTALVAAPSDRVLVVACDMPFLNPGFLQYLTDLAGGVDAAVPRTREGYEPLCAVYASSCAALVRRKIEAGALQLQELVADLRIREVRPEEIAPYDPDGMLFFNVNTPADYEVACAFANRLDTLSSR